MSLSPDQVALLADKLLPIVTEMDRLKALSSIDLIREVFSSEYGDSLKVTELMNRVLPGWEETILEEPLK